MKDIDKAGRKMKWLKSQKGIALLEVLISLAILSILAVGMLSALAAASKVLLQTNARETAKNLAETQMEYIKSEGFVPYIPVFGSTPVVYTPKSGYNAYSLAPITPSLQSRYVPTVAVAQDSRPDIQTITVTVTGPGITYILEDNKIQQ
jgi:type II secretory pathway pseudopilin PulG